MPELVKKFGSKAILVFHGTNCMNQALTEDYLICVIGVPMFTPHRLLVWDSFKCHVSKDTKDSLKKLKVDQAVIPGGCTGFIQAPDVCWNKHFKDSYTKSYDDWFEAGKQKFTVASNPKSVPLEVIVGWIVKAWDGISSDIIVNSFKVFGLTNNLDWSEDEQIIIFKDKKCCAGCLKKFWDQLDSKILAVNIEEAGHEGGDESRRQ